MKRCVRLESLPLSAELDLGHIVIVRVFSIFKMLQKT